MIVTFFDRENRANRLNGTVIRDKSRLLAILQILQNRSPFNCELVSDNGFSLVIGVGKEGFAQYSRDDGTPPFMMAVDRGKDSASGFVEFIIGGTLSRIPTYYCVPFSLVSEIAGYFVETARMYPAIAWEELDPGKFSS
jgi:hypothetical protein